MSDQFVDAAKERMGAIERLLKGTERKLGERARV